MPRGARRSLGRGCWLLLAAAGAWVIALAVGGIVAVPLIFLLLAGLGLWGRQHHGR